MGRDRGYRLSVGQMATLACLLEVTAPKVGNVNRGTDFTDLTFADLVTSAVAISSAMERAAEQGVGRTIFAAVEATQIWVETNTNLGTILLLAPLAAVPLQVPLREGISPVLDQLDVTDARQAFAAIRAARPSGMRRVDWQDVGTVPTMSLLEAMRAAADRDLVARQYANQFLEVLDWVVPDLVQGASQRWPLAWEIVAVQLRLMREFPDSLIARKCGQIVAQEASDRAAEVLSRGCPLDEPYQQALADFDFWLRADGHRRNPGTTADLIAAGLFVAMRDELLPVPLDFFATF